MVNKARFALVHSTPYNRFIYIHFKFPHLNGDLSYAFTPVASEISEVVGLHFLRTFLLDLGLRLIQVYNW